MATQFSEKIVLIIKNIPKGKVLSYGSIAALAGSPRAARQVTRILHSSSKKHNLPWHRVVNSKGGISLKHPEDYALQRELLEADGVEFSLNDRIDFKEYFWKIESIKEIKKVPKPGELCKLDSS